MHRLLRAATTLGLLTLAATAPLAAQENLEMGKMWTFENPPVAYLKDRYGFDASEEWLTNLRMASLRLDSGCSASFVSGQGLIMTNHHCVRDLIAQVQGRNDYVTNGFYAKTEADEIPLMGSGPLGQGAPAPLVKAQQLLKMVDVTAAMNEGITDQMSAEDVAAKREENEAKVIEEHEATDGKAFPNMTLEVVSLFQGAIYQLYVYRDFTDIRLVVAPHLQTAHFGGDPDNFTYPRWAIDFSFCRAYENGKPADTSEHFFKWSEVGPVKGELSFVTGNPGTTNRLKTKAQMEYMRDVELPLQLEQVTGQLTVFRKIVEQFPQAKKQLETTMLGLENNQKASTGYLGGLKDPALMARKAEAEAAFQKRVQASPEFAAKYGSVWQGLAEVAKKKRTAFVNANMHTDLFPAGPLHRAMLIVQSIDPDASEEERTAAAKQAEDMPPQMVGLNPLAAGVMAMHFDMAKKWLPAEDQLAKFLSTYKDGAAVVAALAQSTMGDQDTVLDLLEGGRDIINQSQDPAVTMALVLYPLRSESEAALEKVELEEERLGALIGRALHAAYGTGVSPDATFSLRFSEGLVEGYPYNGTIAPWRTTFHGLYGRSASFGDVYPFNLPQVWKDKMGDIDMSKGVNFVSGNDIIGGNSGSPIVNSKLEVIGLIFDGNIEMLPNNFLYRGDVPRSVSVHVDAIMESMTKIYGAERVVKELTNR